jgi:hypothetical protein
LAECSSSGGRTDPLAAPLKKITDKTFDKAEEALEEIRKKGV